MRFRSVTGGTVAAVATAALLGAGSASAGPSFDHVVGGGSNGNPNADNHFSINAKGTATEAQGKFEFHDTESGPPVERLSADVKCVRAEGNVATVVGQVEKSKNSLMAGRFVILRLEDNGPPQGSNSRDEIRVLLAPAGATQQPACPSPADIPPRGLSQGNITITDGV